jgi:osmoprotectant transport system permease protein
MAEATAPALPLASFRWISLGLAAVSAVLILVGLYAGAWLQIAPNRLLPGQPVTAAEAFGSSLHLVAIGFIALAVAVRSSDAAFTRWATLLLSIGALVGLVVLTGLATAGLMAGRPAAARAFLGAGFWLTVVGQAAICAEAARRAGSRVGAPIGVALALLGFAVGYRAGVFDALSLVVEFRARADLVRGALQRHLELAGAGLALALTAALPLGWLSFRSPRTETVTVSALDALQVVPAIALFGVLVSLLSLGLNAAPALRNLGLAAIGPAPALIGIAGYLALPLVQSLVGGLKAAEDAVIGAARAMGMTEGRIAREVRIPLGMPIFIGGLRVAAVQSIGLTTLGGLIGAGGLGAIVFEGMAQFAPDLILLGAAPIVVLALLIDWALRALERSMSRLEPGS